jgi:acyl-CoA reductase-like NAD-dependent aldehyde dehydrogenase
MLKAGLYHAGQVCVSVQRIFAHEKIAEKLSQALADGATKLKTGDPLEKDTDVGPLITHEDVSRVDDWIKEAEKKGGKVLCGGKNLGESTYAPTVIYKPAEDALVSKEEIFGPAIMVYPFNTLQEAIDRSNSLKYAFQSAIYTTDIDSAMQAASGMNASAVMINDHTAFRVDWMPFGGRDESGLGLGGIPYSMKDMTREKLIVIKSNKLI